MKGTVSSHVHISCCTSTLRVPNVLDPSYCKTSSIHCRCQLFLRRHHSEVMAPHNANDLSIFTLTIPRSKAMAWVWQDYHVVFWMFFSAATILVALCVLACRRGWYATPSRPTHTLVKYTPILPFDVEKEIMPSPFLAYLGHNVLTESAAKNPNNTSVHAIDRIPEHIKLRNTVLSNRTEEPQSYGYDVAEDGIRTNLWRSFTYSDTLNTQVCVSNVGMVHDGNQRYWRRKTLQLCGI